MTNTIENTQTKVTAEKPYIFLEKDGSMNPEREIIVAKKAWFQDVPACEIRNSYGIVEDECENKDENDNCCCKTVRAYEYWNGSNHQHIVIAAPWDVNYSIIDDENEIAEFHEIVAKAKTDNDYPFEEGSTGYRHAQIGGWQVTESIWQDAWEIYTITENEDE